VSEQEKAMEIWRGVPDTGWDKAQEELATLGLTDGLPVVPPTPARVEAMLRAHRYEPEAVVCHLAPMFQPARWQDIAINAVMAGCAADCLPVIGAALEAMAAEEFNLTGVSTTTGSAAPLVIVNGPVASRIGMNGAANALGPGNRANATIGRAVSLCLRNIGGATPGEVDMATLGQPAKYTCSFAENEAQRKRRSSPPGSATASRPPPVSFSPPKAPPISAPEGPMLTLAMPQSEPAAARKRSLSRMSVVKMHDERPCGTSLCSAIASSYAPILLQCRFAA
jgi:hypothetical protein